MEWPAVGLLWQTTKGSRSRALRGRALARSRRGRANLPARSAEPAGRVSGRTCEPLISASHHCCVADVVEPGKLLNQPGIAALEELVLLAGPDAARPFGVFVVERVGHVHPGDDTAEGRERLLVVRLRVITQV